MPQDSNADTQVTILEALLDRASQDTGFRDRLLSSPAATLRAEGISLDQEWVDVIRDLTPDNFESGMQKAISTATAEGEGEGEGNG